MERVQNEADLLLLNRQICFSLYAASNRLTRMYRSVLAEIGLTYPQYLVMLVLWESTPQTVGSLGNRLHLDSGTLTPLLKRMEIAGVISRARDRDDERRVVIELTAKGRKLRTKAAKVPETLGAGLKMKPEEIEVLRERVQALLASLAGTATAAR